MMIAWSRAGRVASGDMVNGPSSLNPQSSQRHATGVIGFPQSGHNALLMSIPNLQFTTVVF
ncbi:MAG: hypothetical protein BWX47_01079 [candidate division Hyd24-12 bacterium ADurb.Bin004]|nr:MAG: hypothetical protein BWX47_01079 [candidate division Hyd24-12 bacterium ADurb.Bin004]